MEKILKITLALLIIIATFISILYYFQLDMFHSLVKEDGLVEYLTAIILLTISIFLLFRLIKLRKTKNIPWIIFNIFMILGLFFGFGEEVSWGQRIFSIESNSFFVENNLQGETNLHNLSVNGVKINKIIFSYGFTIVFGTYFLFSLLLFKKSKFIKILIAKFGIPIPKILHSVILFITTAIILSIPDSRIWELWECLFVLIFFLVMLDPHNVREKIIPHKKEK